MLASTTGQGPVGATMPPPQAAAHNTNIQS